MRGNDIVPLFAMLIFFGSITFIVWKWIESNHKIKTALLEKGFKPEENPLLSKPIVRGMNTLRSLQIGLVVLFIGLGTLIGTIINNAFFWSIVDQYRNNPVNWNLIHRFDSIEGGTMFACITICGGIGLVVFYFIAQKKMKEEQKKA
jgi:hypothetical protein